MINQTSIDNLKAQIDIVDIVSNSLTLKKAGSNFKACCPFHGEDTASFVVSPSKQIYHCFGCSCGGDAIKFVMEYEKLSYPETIEKIANDLNFTLEYDNKSEQKDYKNIFESMNNFYKSELKDDELKYLLDRGITKKSIKTFEIGYASTSNEQINYLKQNFLNISDACDIGILANEKDKLYARQIKRITFPIRNHTGKLIGFGGRTTINHSAKYINSPQTKLFDKSRNFYGYNLAKEHIGMTPIA
jgi:DNA primase